MSAIIQPSKWDLRLYSSGREEVPGHIKDRNLALIKEKLWGDVWNYDAKIWYAVTWELGWNEQVERILWVGEDFELWLRKELFVWPRSWTTSALSTQISAILDMTGVQLKGRVEPIIYHSYDTDLENPEKIIWKSLYDQMTQMAVSHASRIEEMFKIWEKGVLVNIDIISRWKTYLSEFNKKHGLAMYEAYIDYLFTLFTEKYKRNPTEPEVYAFAYANSEHCDHWVFNGHHNIDGEKQIETLFDYIRATNKKHPGKTKVAYEDDAAAYEWKEALVTFTSEDGKVHFTYSKMDNTLKVESHNHPSRIYALEWAATWIGGLLRDLSAIGRWWTPNATTTTIIISDLVESFNRTKEGQESALDIVAEGSVWGANYSNEKGFPAITGNFSVVDAKVGWKHWWYDKPTVIVWWKGNVFPENVESRNVPAWAKIVYLWGSNYNIWMGGGAASSVTKEEGVSELDFASVQRWNPIMQSKVKDLINNLTWLKEINPILKIWDVGASWWTNTVQELLEDVQRGGKIDFSKIPIWDESLWPKEVLSNESQERYICFVLEEDMDDFEARARRFNTPMYVIWETTESTQYVVHDPKTNTNIIDMDINDMLGHSVELILNDETVNIEGGELNLESIRLSDSLKNVISHPTVSNKEALVTIWDRSVWGRVTQEQMVWLWQTPLSNVWVTLHGLEWIHGEVITQANRSALAITNPEASCRMSVITAILKALSAYIPELDSISGSGNWMYAKSEPWQLSAIHKWAKALRDIVDVLQFDISVGKDSGSMKEWDVVSPLTLVTTLYADSGDVYKTLTPELKPVQDSELLLLDFSEWKNRLGWSILAQVNGQFWENVADIDNPEYIRSFMEAMIELHEKNLLLAYHKKSDWGLFSAISEMSFGSHIGIDIDISSLMNTNSHEDTLRALFNEEAGIVMQFETSKKADILEILKKYKLDHLGHSIWKPNFEKQNIWVAAFGEKIIDERRVDLQKAWSVTSHVIRKHRKNNNPETTQAEFDRINDEFEPWMKDVLNFDISEHEVHEIISDYETNNKQKPKMAVLSTEGTNSQEEMKRYFHRAGFEVYDVHLNDLISWKHSLDDFRAVAIAGGFSHGDALWAWVWFAQTILERPELRAQFEKYTGKLFGVCNGFQVITQLAEILPWGENFPKLLHNTSNSFEARKVQVKISEKEDSQFLKWMWGSILSQINSHGEGRVTGGSLDYGINFVDHRWNKTESYPHNPNGSPDGATWFELWNICAMMWHPEREWRSDSPWLQIAFNMRLAIENEMLEEKRSYIGLKRTKG